MRLNEQATRDLVRVGLLETMTEYKCGRKGRLVPLAAISAFEAVYVSASELAWRSGTSPKAIVLDLEKSGISPVTGPKVDGGRQYFFSKASLSENLLVSKASAA